MNNIYKNKLKNSDYKHKIKHKINKLLFIYILITFKIKSIKYYATYF